MIKVKANKIVSASIGGVFAFMSQNAGYDSSYDNVSHSQFIYGSDSDGFSFVLEDVSYDSAAESNLSDNNDEFVDQNISGNESDNKSTSKKSDSEDSNSNTKEQYTYYYFNLHDNLNLRFNNISFAHDSMSRLQSLDLSLKDKESFSRSGDCSFTVLSVPFDYEYQCISDDSLFKDRQDSYADLSYIKRGSRVKYTPDCGSIFKFSQSQQAGVLSKEQGGNDFLGQISVPSARSDINNNYVIECIGGISINRETLKIKFSGTLTRDADASILDSKLGLCPEDELSKCLSVGADIEIIW